MTTQWVKFAEWVSWYEVDNAEDLNRTGRWVSAHTGNSGNNGVTAKCTRPITAIASSAELDRIRLLLVNARIKEALTHD